MNKELQIHILALVKILEEVEVKGYNNLSKLATVINELQKTVAIAQEEEKKKE